MHRFSAPIRAAAALAAAIVPLAFGAAAEHPRNDALERVTNVYILPMNNGLDQYLASHLSRLGAFTIVTDPKKADAILTDHVGESFERKMAELYPPPKPPKPPAADTDSADKKDDSKSASKSAAEASREEADRLAHENQIPMVSTFGRGRGMVFLVDRSGRVLWSFYKRPKNTQPQTLDRTALLIARRLSDERNPPVKKSSDGAPQ